METNYSVFVLGKMCKIGFYFPKDSFAVQVDEIKSTDLLTMK